MPDGQLDICQKKLMSVSPDMRVTYFLERDADNGGLCYVERPGEMNYFRWIDGFLAECTRERFPPPTGFIIHPTVRNSMKAVMRTLVTEWPGVGLVKGRLSYYRDIPLYESMDVDEIKPIWELQTDDKHAFLFRR